MTDPSTEPQGSSAVVRVYAREYRCGSFELEEAGSGDHGYEVPRKLWQALIAADEAVAEATQRQHRLTLAVVEHIVATNPDAEEPFPEWEALGMRAFDEPGRGRVEL